MECYACQKNGITICEVIGIFLAIIAGVAVGILFAAELIPAIASFIIIALVASAVSLLILVGSLFTANIIKGSNCFYRCICKFARFVLVGSVGTLLAATTAITAGLVVTAIASIILVALSAFFFVLMIVAIICLISCIIQQTCTRERE